ncbi:acid protease [Ramaria rubella]|nr:acid protease [Ramaria rubella]
MSNLRILLSTILLVSTTTAFPSRPEHNTVTFKRSDTVSIQTTLKIGNASIDEIIRSDRARSQAFSRGLQGYSSINSSAPVLSNKSGNDSLPVQSPTGFIATANVQIGNPSTTYQLIVDTGSSNTFVGANKSYTHTSSSQDTGEKVAVSYGSGFFEGEEFDDDVTLGGVTISQSIGVALASNGFQGFDGILGLGPDDLTEGTLLSEPTQSIPTVTDNLAKQGKTPSALVGVFFPLTTSSAEIDGGSLDFGSPDTSKFTGDIAYVPITQTPGANAFWGIDQSITYGNNSTPILTKGSGIVDTGTSLLLLASDAFQAYVSATGATMDQTTGFLTIDNPNNLQSLFFNMGGVTFEFTANAQILPRVLTSGLSGGSNLTYLIVGDNGSQLGQGNDFTNGFTFLQRFYSVFDTPNSRVGFANTIQTRATSN